MEVISKEEFLRACNQKIKQDIEEERRRKEEEERRREEEKRRKQEEERRRREEENKNKEWDAWYSRLPSNCKKGFVWNGFSYRVNPNTRSITKQSLNKDERVDDIFLKGSRDFASSSLNQELGI